MQQRRAPPAAAVAGKCTLRGNLPGTTLAGGHLPGTLGRRLAGDAWETRRRQPARGQAANRLQQRWLQRWPASAPAGDTCRGHLPAEAQEGWKQRWLAGESAPGESAATAAVPSASSTARPSMQHLPFIATAGTLPQLSMGTS